MENLIMELMKNVNYVIIHAKVVLNLTNALSVVETDKDQIQTLNVIVLKTLCRNIIIHIIAQVIINFYFLR